MRVSSGFIFYGFFFISPASSFLQQTQAHWQSTTRASTYIKSNISDDQKSVIIVGGGIGGLAVAARVASLSPKAKVTILEKNDFVGGRCGSFDVEVAGTGVFRHERGPSLLLLPQIYRKLFSDCNTTPEENGLAYVQCVPAYQVVFEDGETIRLGFTREETKLCSEELKSRAKMDEIEENGAAKWDKYQRICEAYLDCGLPNFIEEKLDIASFSAFLRESLTDTGAAWPLKPHSDVLDKLFTSDKMRAMASFQDLYVGLEPYKNTNALAGGVVTTTAPAVFGLLSAIELHPTNKKCGVFAPKGGFESVTKAVQNLAMKAGVKIQTDVFVTSVTETEVHYETGGTKGRLQADVVVMNADLPYASEVLLNQGSNEDTFPRYDWDDKYLFSSGVVAFHWSVRRPLEGLDTHNVFLAYGERERVEDSWSALRGGKDLESEQWSSSKPFNFYVHRACASDPSAAPPGCDSILVLVPCPTLQRDVAQSSKPRDEAIQKYSSKLPSSQIDSMREAVLQRLSAVSSLSSLQDDIIDEVVDHPATYADQYNLAAGTPFGLSHGFGQLSKLRPGMTSSPQKNVVFCGASTRPGNGVPLVLIGAEKAAEAVIMKL